MSRFIQTDEEQNKIQCCTGSLIGVTQDGTKTKIIPLYCHKWSCPRCRKTKSSLWRMISVSGKPERFITLTLRHTPGRTCRDHALLIKQAFPRLVQKIRRKFGEFEYLLIFELQKNGTPHIHILQRGAYVPQAWLSTEWMRLTGSFIVDIRSIKSTSDVSNYLTKYMGKAIAAVAEKLHGLRIIQKSKDYVITAPGMELPVQDQETADVLTWYYCHAHPSQVLAAARTLVPDSVITVDDRTVYTIRGPTHPDLVHELIYWCTGYPYDD